MHSTTYNGQYYTSSTKAAHIGASIVLIHV